MPNFLVIGAVKAGTTSLYHYLQEHPQVYMSSVKEPRFFVLEGKQSDEQNAPGFLRTRITTIEAYRALFDGVTTEVAIGEATPDYIHDPEAAPRIQQHLPDVRLIAMLRNPVDRAFSHYWQLIRHAERPMSDFAQDVQKAIERDWEHSLVK